jgi:hypothetical protein
MAMIVVLHYSNHLHVQDILYSREHNMKHGLLMDLWYNHVQPAGPDNFAT